MKRVLSIFVLAVLTAGLLVPLAAAQRTVARQPVHGSQVFKRTKALVQKITWYDNLEDLKAEAQRRGKMIYWLQIVGDLDEGL